MANLKDIRTRIASVKNTRKITSAMSRIASARLRRAQTAMESARDYGDRMSAVVAEVVGGIEDSRSSHDFLAPKPELSRIVLVVVTADRGLCGGFNSNVSRAAGRFIRAQRELNREVLLVTVGKKSHGYIKALEIEIERSFEAPAIDTVVPLAKLIAADVTMRFVDCGVDEAESSEVSVPKINEADEVHLIYNHFKNVIAQEVRTLRLLPFEVADGQTDSDSEKTAVRCFEPGQQELLNHLLPIALETTIQQALINSAAAEVAARRAAMDSATTNAGDLIADLTLLFNRERQAAITKELMEIVGGAEALKG